MVLTGGSFRKGVRVFRGVPRKVWGQVQGGGWGAAFLENRGKGKGGEGGGGVGGRGGTGKGTGKSMPKLCRNYPSAICPLVVARRHLQLKNCPRKTEESGLVDWGLGQGYRCDGNES